MKVFVNLLKSNRGNNGCNPSFFGYCWGFWFPRFNWNKGNPFQEQVFDFSISWIVWCFTVSLWPKWRQIEKADTQISPELLTDKEQEDVK